jgi:hypothetical protein
MDEESHDSGLGGLAWYQLGRMSAESDRVRSDAIDAVLARRRGISTQQTLHAQNQALAAENAQLRQELADYQLNYRNLKAWANRAEARIDQLLKDRGE